jgi:hypothetical protein
LSVWGEKLLNDLFNSNSCRQCYEHFRLFIAFDFF